MAKKDAKAATKPRVVFDLSMPRYEYRDTGGHSLSVDRKREPEKKVAPNTLSHLKVQ